MNRLITSGLALALCTAGVAASAADMTAPTDPSATAPTAMPCAGMKGLDANGDGLISKDEFTKHHDAMWSKMKKDAGGNVSVKELEAIHAGKMKQ